MEREGASLSRKYRRAGSKDPTLTGRDRLGATLDHIVPRSLALIADDSPANLRLAHRSCNSARGNRHAAGA